MTKNNITSNLHLPLPPPPLRWLTQGKIEFENVSLSYAPDLPPVLRDISLRIEAGERVGVCGRTGAGKSSLAAALFNLVSL